jgi:hypothetical protein
MIENDYNTSLFDYDLEEVKKISIKQFLERIGISVTRKRKYFVARSPLSEDRDPSFTIYPENTFYDWSTGIGGTIIDLVMSLYRVTFKEAIKILENDSVKDLKITKQELPPIRKQKFNIEMYYSKNATNHKLVRQYMEGRRITFDECNAGNYFVKHGHNWKANLSLMFYHRDEFGNICGAKFRNINDNDKSDQNTRWTSRGRLFYYTLEHITNPGITPAVFITESETSSNSLFNYLKELGKRNFVILSFGGVNSAPNILPLKYEWINKNRYVLIDYDGDEILYTKRIKALEHLCSRDIKLVLPKGEDINSLWMADKMSRYDNLFNKIL